MTNKYVKRSKKEINKLTEQVMMALLESATGCNNEIKDLTFNPLLETPNLVVHYKDGTKGTFLFLGW